MRAFGKTSALLLFLGIVFVPAHVAAQESAADEADAQRLTAIIRDAAGSAKTARLAVGWSTFSFGVIEVGAGGVLLGTLTDDALRTSVPLSLFLSGGLTMGVSIPNLVIKSEMEKLADRSARDLADPSLPPKERISRTIGGLRTVADTEERGRVLGVVAASILLAVCGGGVVVTFAIGGLTSDQRAGLATAFGVLGAIDIVTLVAAALYRPAEHALDVWERGQAKSSFRVTPVIGPTGLGLVGAF